jgi:uncharacterized Zn-finger protein
MENNKIENVHTKEVSCSGDTYSKHPLVYLKIVKETGKVVCPYCSKTFLYSADK